MRTHDIEALISNVGTTLHGPNNQAVKNELDRVLLKNCLENMRSALDYLAQDIAEALRAKDPRAAIPRRIYFPYGQRQNHFRLSVNKNLPGLRERLPLVYDAIHNRQPFFSGDNWLVEVCELTNEAKHNQLNKTEEEPATKVSIPGVFNGRVQDGGFWNNYVNGVLVDDVIVKNGKVVNHIKRIPGVVVTEDNRIVFRGKRLDVLQFLEYTHNKMSELTKEIALLLEAAR